jgi:two-component system, NarL family, response regulator LiaR
MMAQVINILIADDHPIVREGLRALLSGKPDMALVGEARDGDEAVAKARSLRPDVILMDLVMPRKNGIEAIREIRQENAQARILVLSTFSEDERIIAAIKGGALGYLLKDSSPQELIEAIRCVHRGESSLHPAVARKLILAYGKEQRVAPAATALTEREAEVLKLVARGLSNHAIAERLFVGEGTVRFHVSNILGKLQLENRTQAVLYALREGMVDLQDEPEG